MPKLLVFTPTFGDGPRPETLEAIDRLRFDGELVREVSWHNPFPGADNMRNVTAQYQRAHDLVIFGSFDALLCVEHDMVPPRHAAQTLWDDGGQVVYGVYRLRHGDVVINLFAKEGRTIGTPLSMLPAEMRKGRAAGRMEIAGLGFGCTLMRRDVLEKIRFRDEHGNAPDVPFAEDCLRRGVAQFGRFDVPCGHIAEGVLLEPYTEEGIAARVYALEDATLESKGEPYFIERGRYYTVPPSDALRWRAGGYVRITNGT